MHARQFIADSTAILAQLDPAVLERMAGLLAETRERGGRLFILGVGGGAGHASHAVCDFRKLAQIEAYTPCDNVSELTARTNDEGWETTYAEWLTGSRVRAEDLIFVFSVGGGDEAHGVSLNLVRALQRARAAGARVIGVVGRDGGYTAQVAEACVIVPTINKESVTPQTESFQAWVWHLLVTHPLVQRTGMKWETTAR